MSGVVLVLPTYAFTVRRGIKSKYRYYWRAVSPSRCRAHGLGPSFANL